MSIYQTTFNVRYIGPGLQRKRQHKKSWCTVPPTWSERYVESPYRNTTFFSCNQLWRSMASSDTHEKTQQLLRAALAGDLRRFKKLAAELDDGKGIAKTVAGITDGMGVTPLHLASLGGRMDLCKYLISDLKVDVNAKEVQGGRTPLFCAFIGKHLKVATYILKNGADPCSVWPNEKGWTPLHYAAEMGDKGLVHMLLSKGANVNALSSDGTPLQKAGLKGNHEVVKLLLNHHADPNINYRNVCTPLLASISANSLLCVQLLLEAGADPDGRGLGMTPLELAATDGQTSMILSLSKAGANPNLTSEEGLKPIEIAAVNDNLQAVEILFPATSRISTYPNWSVSEIMRHAHSEGAGVQRKLVQKEKFGDAKSKGDDAYLKKDYITASFCYSKAIIKDPSNAILLSNRSLCWACLNDGVAALNDAMACILLEPHWPKAYYRLGAAWKILGKFDQTADSFYDGLKLDPLSRELKKAYQEAFVEAMLQSISPSAR